MSCNYTFDRAAEPDTVQNDTIEQYSKITLRRAGDIQHDTKDYNMALPYGILAIYGALAVWIGLLVQAYRRGSYGIFLVFGIGMMLILNMGYFLNGAPNAIAFFIGIYDVLDNLGTDAAPALATCPDNACTVWGERYLNHPSWGVSFYDRFANGSAARTNLLLGHIGLNSIVFVLMHVQLMRPGFAPHKKMHSILGRVSFVCLTISTVCAVILAGQHGDVVSYGGSMSTYGFWFMSFCVYGCATMGVLAIRNGDHATHRKWMIRFVGAMWGAYWIFRVMLFVLGPLLRQWDSAALLTVIWFSAPLGILIAEIVRRRLSGGSTQAQPV